MNDADKRVYRDALERWARDHNTIAHLSGETIVRAHDRDRERPETHFDRVALKWSRTLGVPVTAADVCLCMIALKQAREEFKHDPDNGADAVGYLLCLERVRAATKDKTT